jgi:hypothetical protein
MRLLPWLLSFLFPLCATTGSSGVPAPGLVDFQHLVRTGHHSALIAPPGYNPVTDLVAPIFPIPAAQLFTALQTTALAMPRTYRLDAEPGQYQAAFVVRTEKANFPDIVALTAIPLSPTTSSYAFYSHSIYGRSDFGVNLARAKSFATSLQQRVSD